MKRLIASTIFAAAAVSVAQAGELWRATGFEQPESALVDSAHNRIVVSNISGNPGAADGNGYLSLLSMDGKVIARHWVDGMDAPKGMAIAGGKLYAADITKVRVVDLASGRLVETIDVPGAVFLNDMTEDKAGKVYVSDMLADMIYRIDGDKPELFVKDPLLASPNGLFADGHRLIVASWGKDINKADFSTAEPGGLLSVDLATKKITPLPGAENFADLDGVIAIGGTIYATAYMTGTLYSYHDGAPQVVATFKPGSADIGTDGKRIFVPLMGEGEIVALSLD